MARQWLIAAMLIACGAPVQALACSPPPGPPPPPPTAEQVEHGWVSSFANASDMVDVVMLTTATDGQYGKARVRHSYKGKTRSGAIILIETRAGSACGPGDVYAGQAYRLMLTAKSPYWFQPVSEDGYKALIRRGLIRPRKPAGSPKS